MQKAVQAVADARDRANRAADAYTDAENKLDDLTEQQAQLQKDIDATSAKVDALANGITNLAVDRVVNGDGGSSLFAGLTGPTQQVEQEVISRLALNASTTSIDEYDAARHELDLKKATLDRTKKETEQAAAYLKASQEKALSDIEVLKQLEDKALKDRAVAQALAARKAAEKRQIEQQAAAAAAGGSQGAGGVGRGELGSRRWHVELLRRRCLGRRRAGVRARAGRRRVPRRLRLRRHGDHLPTGWPVGVR